MNIYLEWQGLEDEEIKYLADEKWFSRLTSLQLLKVVIFREEQSHIKGTGTPVQRQMEETKGTLSK